MAKFQMAMLRMAYVETAMKTWGWLLRIGSLAIPLLMSPHLASAADDLKVIKLEQDVLDLQREMQVQSRRIESLERQLRQALATTPRSNGREAVRDNDPTRLWLEDSNWDKLRVGMTESEAIRTLGPPNSTRLSPEDKTRTLFYAMELEAGGFLSGQVIVADQKVVEVRKPELK
jgi:hypothetical protein